MRGLVICRCYCYAATEFCIFDYARQQLSHKPSDLSLYITGLEVQKTHDKCGQRLPLEKFTNRRHFAPCFKVICGAFHMRV
jgi:hypothetical protein